MSGSEAHDEDEQQRSKRALRARNAVNYSEDSIRWENIVLEEEYTDSIRPTKKIKVGGPGDAPAAVFADNQLEEETAWAVGLNAKAISEEEEDLLPPGADEAAYTRIRNWVLSRWREDVSRYLPEEEAQDGVPHKHREYALAAWRFLNAAGYINFGIAPHLLERAEQTPQDRGTVIVVGAGLSGMAAARQLRAFGFKVVVVEGHARPGGRVYSKRLEGQGLHAVADMGGSVITGIDGNPLAILAKQLQIPLHLINTQQVPLHVEDGSEANKAIDDQTEAKYNTLLDTCSQARDDMGDIADHISLGTALETLWRDLARRASHRAATTSQPAEPAKPRKRGRPAKRPVGTEAAKPVPGSADAADQNGEVSAVATHREAGTEADMNHEGLPAGAAKSNVGLPAISDADLVVSELRDNDAAPSARDTPAPMAVDVTAPSKLPGTVIDLTAQSGSVPRYGINPAQSSMAGQAWAAQLRVAAEPAPVAAENGVSSRAVAAAGSGAQRFDAEGAPNQATVREEADQHVSGNGHVANDDGGMPDAVLSRPALSAEPALPGRTGALPAGASDSDSTAAQAHPRKGLTAAGDAELDGDTAQKEQSAAKLERRLLDWHFANLEFANAAVLHTLSMRNWDQDDPYELQGGHCFLPGGNLRLVAGLAKGLPIFYNSPVQEIRYCQSGVVVQTPTHALKGDAVVVSVPLGVLKKGSITFTPPLPQRKQETIQRLGFGVLNKVVLLFPYVFWQTTLDMFGRVAETTSERGEFFLFYSYAHIAGGPLLIALVSGEAAERFEQVPAAASVAKVMATLRAIFGRKGVQVPPPVQACCTRWGQDPMAYGSYSSIAVGALGGEDYDVLAENIGGRVFFAGEATTRKYPATMHGAFFTGLREAANVSATFAARAATAKRQSAEAAKQAAKPATQEQAAAAREARQQRELDKAAQAQTLAQLSRQLVQVFVSKEFPCDAEFGCFALVYGPEGSEFSEEALVRLDIGDTQGRSRRAMPMFFTLAREDAIRLRDMAGDEARINFLVYSLGVKLVGRSSLPERARALLQAICAARPPQTGSDTLQPADPAAGLGMGDLAGLQQLVSSVQQSLGGVKPEPATAGATAGQYLPPSPPAWQSGAGPQPGHGAQPSQGQQWQAQGGAAPAAYAHAFTGFGHQYSGGSGQQGGYGAAGGAYSAGPSRPPGWSIMQPGHYSAAYTADSTGVYPAAAQQYPAAEQPPYQPAAGLQYFSGDSYASAQPYPPASLDTQPTQAYPPDSYGRDFYAAPQAGSVQPRGAASYHIDSVRPGQRGGPGPWRSGGGGGRQQPQQQRDWQQAQHRQHPKHDGGW